MANVYKDSSSGKWISQVKIGYYENGRPKYKRFKSDTKKEALQRLDEYSFLEGESNISTAEYIKQYINIYKKNKIKASSLTRDYGILENQISPRIGDYAIEELTSSIIQSELINKLVDEKYSHSTIHKAYTLLNEALKKAVLENRLSKNPCVGVNMPSQKSIKPKEIEILTEDEIREFLKVANIQKYANGLAISLIVYTGLRCGELCALKWSDIDFENRIITVQRNISVSEVTDENGDKKRIVELQDGTKTRLKRTVPLNDKAIEILNKIKAKSKSDFVIQTRSKVPDTSQIAKTYNSMIAYAGIEGRTGIHTLRHTFASVLIKKGVDIKVISEILGHSSVSFTYKTYIHLFPEQKTNALDLIDY